MENIQRGATQLVAGLHQWLFMSDRLKTLNPSSWFRPTKEIELTYYGFTGWLINLLIYLTSNYYWVWLWWGICISICICIGNKQNIQWSICADGWHSLLALVGDFMCFLKASMEWGSTREERVLICIGVSRYDVEFLSVIGVCSEVSSGEDVSFRYGDFLVYCL